MFAKLRYSISLCVMPFVLTLTGVHIQRSRPLPFLGLCVRARGSPLRQSWRFGPTPPLQYHRKRPSRHSTLALVVRALRPLDPRDRRARQCHHVRLYSLSYPREVGGFLLGVVARPLIDAHRQSRLLDRCRRP